MKKYIFTLIITTAALLAATGAARAGETIGSEALIELPTSALWSGYVNFRPGDGEVVALNPPRFSWSYNPDPAKQDCTPGYAPCANWSLNEFIFQASRNDSFTDIIFSTTTLSNSFNMLAPFDPGSTVYWRVGYIRPNNMNYPYTWHLPPVEGWDIDHIVWSRTRSFRVASKASGDPIDAKVWDRSMLTDDPAINKTHQGYLAQAGQHPHMLFNNSNRLQLYQYLKSAEDTDASRGVGKSWRSAKQKAEQIIAASWWPNSRPPNESIGSWAYDISNVAFVWQMTYDAVQGSADRALADRIHASNPAAALNALSSYYQSVNFVVGDPTDDMSARSTYLNFPLAYDYLYDDLVSSGTQPQVLNSLEGFCLARRSLFYSRTNWGTGPVTGPYYVAYYSGFKRNSSHPIDVFYSAMRMALAAFSDPGATHSRQLFDLGVNYMIGVTYPWGMEGGVNQGRGYSNTNLFEFNALYTHQLYDLSLPGANFNSNPFWTTTLDWWDRMVPVGFTEAHDPWGDLGGGRVQAWKNFGLDLGQFTGSSRAVQHQKAEAVYANPYNEAYPFYYLPSGAFYSTPTDTVQSISDSEIMPGEGWVFGCSADPSTPDCFNNGVGFVFQARPKGAEGEHSNASDLSFQIWAYGTSITDGGGGMGGINKGPLGNYSLLINGKGERQPTNPVEPAYSRLFAYKPGLNYVYMAADATMAYPHSSSNGWIYQNAPMDYLQKVRRHFLWVRDKYFVIYDDLSSNQNGGTKFTSLYPILEDTLNAEALNSNGIFTYTSNVQKFLNSASAAGAVTVQVAIMNDPQTLDIQKMSGTSVFTNPITNETYASDPSYDGSYNRAHTLWFSNNNMTNDFHFMYVVYPKNPVDTGDPLIERLDDYTARVTSPDRKEVDIIRFNPGTGAALNAEAQPTIGIDLARLTPLLVPDGGYGLQVGDLSADGSITAYDAALALQLSKGELEAAQIAQRAVGLL